MALRLQQEGHRAPALGGGGVASSQDRTPWEEALNHTVLREAGRRTATGEPLPPESMTERAGEARGPRVITATTTQPTQPVTQRLGPSLMARQRKAGQFQAWKLHISASGAPYRSGVQ